MLSGIIVQAAFDNAYSAGLLIVASAGNSGKPTGRGDNVGYPARYASVIAVADSNSSDIRASFSSTGPDVELTAPGVAINSTKLGGGYVEYSGTSMASPHVAGTAALVLGKTSGLSNVGVRAILTSTAQGLGTLGRDSFYGYGLVRADLALAFLEPPVTGTLHIGGLSGVPVRVNAKKWKAMVTVTVHDGNHNPVPGATVAGTWSTGGTSTVTTGTDGTCTIYSGNLSTSVAGTTFTVTGIGAAGYTYEPLDNDVSDAFTVNR